MTSEELSGMMNVSYAVEGVDGVQEVRSDEERSDELITQSQAAATPRAHSFLQGAPPP